MVVVDEENSSDEHGVVVARVQLGRRHVVQEVTWVRVVEHGVQRKQVHVVHRDVVAVGSAQQVPDVDQGRAVEPEGGGSSVTMTTKTTQKGVSLTTKWKRTGFQKRFVPVERPWSQINVRPSEAQNWWWECQYFWGQEGRSLDLRGMCNIPKGGCK